MFQQFPVHEVHSPALPSHCATKVLLLKPKHKAASKETYAHVLALTIAEVPLNLQTLTKLLGLKELRVAQEEAVQHAFNCSKDQVSLGMLENLDAPTKQTILVLIDESLSKVPTPLTTRSSTDHNKLILLSYAELNEALVKSGVTVKYLVFEPQDLVVTTTEKKKESTASTKKSTPATKQSAQAAQEDAGDANKRGIEVKKDVDFPRWYKQVLTKSEMLDYYDVSGCYIIRPLAYFVWKEITAFFDKEIEELGVEDTYFPMFVSAKALEREKDHIEGFAPEVAWVTKAGSSDLEEPVAIRPTSETVMYPYFAKWIRSHRDLPLRVNQWCNVVRWEFKNPQPFLRTREFLWQEGHTAHLTKESAGEEVSQILDLYRRVYEDLLAVPVITGKKSENEKFAGALYTTTCEGFIPTTGRGIQGATSHCLGQNFAKMFNIVVEDPNHPADAKQAAEKLFVWQNSWGLSTRSLGVMVMVHGDDKGLVLPPKVASVQVIVIPCGLTVNTTKEEREKIEEQVKSTVQALKSAGVRAKHDLRDNITPGNKFYHWELRGVPIRIEVGPKDMISRSVLTVRRDNSERCVIKWDELVKKVPEMLINIHQTMYDRAYQTFHSHVKKIECWDQVVPALDDKNLLLLPWCEEPTCEDQIKNRSAKEAAELRAGEEQDEKAPSMGAKSLCIPFKQPTDGVEGKKCVNCGKAAKSWTLFGRSY